jgi:YHS domain-containing protein
MERDPVCGMDLRPGQEEASFTLQDKTYHFCSTECCKMFQGNPKQYIKEMEAAARQQ